MKELRQITAGDNVNVQSHDQEESKLNSTINTNSAAVFHNEQSFASIILFNLLSSWS